ncbi:MAG: DctP family TRAP transporter solute-binding subunit [Synergistaceae bacterium]|jgi:tripartite ATP-independent transporter DctP family solute receptor|nr:DctP family TRAP transporter solute-binding subunit [Synergistaceae bacterium]
MRRFSTVIVMGLLFVLLSLPAAEAAAKFKMKLHTVGAETHASVPSLREFKRYVEEKTGGDIEVSLHINASLGGDRQAIEAMQLGTLEGGIVGGSIVAVFEPKFNVFEFPFLFNNHDAAIKFLDGPNGEILDKELQKQDVRIIGWGVNGFRHISNNRGPITKPDDLKGLKIRTMENPIHLSTFKLLGSNPTPMNFGELYTALSQKTVDAQENPVTLVYTSKFYEVQKYYSLTGHIYAVAPFAVSEIFFRQLPEEYQKVVIEAGKVYTDMERKLTFEEEDNMLAELRKNGMEVNELSDAEKEVFKKQVMPVYDEFRDRVGDELMNAVLKAND